MTANTKKTKLPQQEDFTKVDYTQKVLEVKNLKKHFFLGSGSGRIVVPAVDDVTFDVYKREVFGLVGESGCGKTTTGRTIIKLYNATEGTVDLNGVRIGAGYLNHIAKIKEIKLQAKEDILSLDKNKLAGILLKKKATEAIDLIKGDIKKLRHTHLADLKAARKPLEDYKDEVYSLKNLYLLDVSNIKYDASLEESKILKQTTNQFEAELDNEQKIAKTTYLNKKSGIKDSAALSKEVINKRLVELKNEYDTQLLELEARFRPLIEGEKGNTLPKSDAKAQIKVLKEKTSELLLERKKQYLEAQKLVKLPEKEQVETKLAKLKEAHKTKVEALKETIKQTDEKNKAEIALLPKSVGFTAEQKLKAKQIKESSKEAIKEQKRIIRDVKTMNAAKDTLKASQKMQMIFQDPISSLNPRMTVKEIIGEGLKIQGGYDTETINEMVAEVLEIVGLSPEYATRYPHEFSGGQRQRIGIARALIMNPNFIIADEPISALDVSIRAQVINLLTNLKEKLGLTILFIAHDLSVVRFFCDRIAVMYYGKIVELAPSEELFKNPQHPYTISLLSAIPQPDPDYEKGRKRIHYNANMHDYRTDKPSLREISKGHMVYVNDKEFAEMKKNYGKKSADLTPKETKA